MYIKRLPLAEIMFFSISYIEDVDLIYLLQMLFKYHLDLNSDFEMQ